MSQTGIGTSLTALSQLQAVIQARAHALTTFSGSTSSPEFMGRAQELLVELANGSAQVAGGQGSIPDAAWESFLDTMRRQQYTYDSQLQRITGGASSALQVGGRQITLPAIIGVVGVAALAYYVLERRK